MDVYEALEVLGVTDQDREDYVKKRYRLLMRLHHPDSAGKDEAGARGESQRINEAYGLLKSRFARESGREEERGKQPARTASREKRHEKVWEARRCEAAFIERRVYMSRESFDGFMDRDFTIAEGKYLWEPKAEEFPMLLKSLNEAAGELLQRRRGSSLPEEEQKELHMQLFHCLAGQYIDPVYSLKSLFRGEREGAEEIYAFPAFLKGGGGRKVGAGEFLYPAGMSRNRLVAADRTACPLGYLTFTDDRLYYILLPILQKRIGQVRITVTEAERGKNHPASLILELKIPERAIWPKEEADRLGEQICKLLGPA